MLFWIPIKQEAVEDKTCPGLRVMLFWIPIKLNNKQIGMSFV